ncbi:MAG: phosphopentomutase [Mycoplasmataceae bacterium]|nr:phosphopentomutase [Mycoplasmataceae bacterium]
MKKKYNRIMMVVTDSLGIGGDVRQKEFGDEGANTLLHVSENFQLEIPMWKKLGITSIAKIHNPGKISSQLAYTARVNEISNGKDTLTGHWEMMGIETKHPFPVFTKNGFPIEMLDELAKVFDGRKIIGNIAESGTVIIDQLAEEEINNNSIIIYTSADSTLQICGHEKHMGLDNLYRYAQAARDICSSRPEWNVGRVIARPYIGSNGKWERTFNRHDYAVEPPKNTILNRLHKEGVNVISIGKIRDIFSNQGISKHYASGSDEKGMDILIDLAMKKTSNEFLFLNLVQFDSHYGHRRDVEGYGKNINQFDIKLSKLVNAMKEDDLLIITSDHGNDPTFKGSDHTRENLPATIYSKSFIEPKKLPDFNGLATLGNIVASNFEIDIANIGDDIFEKLK